MAHLHQPEEIQVIILEESMEGGKVVPLYGVTKIVTLSLIGTQVQFKFIDFCSNLDIFADIFDIQIIFLFIQIMLNIYGLSVSLCMLPVYASGLPRMASFSI